MEQKPMIDTKDERLLTYAAILQNAILVAINFIMVA
jgi:hypothetical protein